MFEKIIKRFFWVPLGLGIIGYMRLGTMDIWHAVYASIALYFVNPVTDADNALILIAELLAVMVTAGVVLTLLSSVIRRVGHFFVRLSKQASVVYGDAPYAEDIAASLKCGYLVSDPKEPEKVTTHIVAFSDDEATLKFYSENKAAVASANSRAYLILNGIDPFLLSDTAGSNTHFVSVSELVARRFWHENNLYDRMVHDGDEVRLAFVGGGQKLYSLIRHAYLNLVYTTGQKIEYHIYSGNIADNNYFAGLETANDDSFIVHPDGWQGALGEISKMTDVIIAFEKDETDTLDILQRLLRMAPALHIYAYSENDTDYGDLFGAENLVTFGNIGALLTEDFIINEPLDRAAKLFNYDYTLRAAGRSASSDYMDRAEDEWRGLNGFFRGSNTARADHHYIERRLYDDGASEEEIEEVEHIRWCRYYYANGWSYAPVRDNGKKKHNLLVPFSELSEQEKRKDGIYDPQLKTEIERLCI